jgi:hypothetical protein
MAQRKQSGLDICRRGSTRQHQSATIALWLSGLSLLVAAAGLWKGH